MNTPETFKPRDWAIASAISLSYLLALYLTAPDIGFSRDESWYFIAAQRYSDWLLEFLKSPATALQKEFVAKFWLENREHPPLVKAWAALFWIMQKKVHLFPLDTLALRFPAMIMNACLPGLIYLWGRQSVSQWAGLFAALSFSLLPRVFHHAHLCCFDVPIAFWITLAAYCYWRGLYSRGWSIAFGIAFGCALLTKHNSWLLPPVLLVHWLVLRSRVASFVRPEIFPGIHRPFWMISLLTVSPLLFYLFWPLLWHAPLVALRDYINFHVNHEYYNMAFFGHNYFRPPFPKSYPWVMTAFTVPFTFLALGLWGIILCSRDAWTSKLKDSHILTTQVLWLGCFLAPLCVYLLPNTPIFGGTKHWFPSYPFLALFAGAAFHEVTKDLRWRAVGPMGLRLGLGALLLAPSVIEWRHSAGFALSHYTGLAGGTPGAADKGMNRVFWGHNSAQLAPYFNRQLPQGGSVWIGDSSPAAWYFLQRDHKLAPNITPASDLASADFVIVDEEHHFAEVRYQAWQAFGSVAPVHILAHDGVPILTVYKNPHGRGKD